MTAKTTQAPDFAGTRTKLQAEVAATEQRLEAVDGRLGELALDVELGNAPAAELDTARTEQAHLRSRLAELDAALEVLDEREAEHVAAEAEKQRKADEAEYARLMTTVQAAGGVVVELVGKLAVVVADAVEAENAAVVIARRLDLQPASRQRGHVVDDFATLLAARLHEYVPTLGYARPVHGDEAASRLREGANSVRQPLSA